MMIVPSIPAAKLYNSSQTMATDTETYSRANYTTAAYNAGESFYAPNTDAAADAVGQYRDWEVHMYNQMQSAAAAESEYQLSARKVQDYSYPEQEASVYPPGYQPGEYPYQNQSVSTAAAVYYGQEVRENPYYNPEQLAAQQYYQQQAAAGITADLYYPQHTHLEPEDYQANYDGSNESLSYHSADSTGRPSPRHHYDSSPHPSSPGCRKYTPIYVQSANAAMLQRTDNAALLCAVCGDNAACQHYGVRTCEGCKGFFKRTVQKKAKYVCLADKKCPVDKRRRNRCQFCRFQKCLAVGMVKEVVRSDSLKGRRGRLPSKPKNPNENAPSPPIPLITTLVRAHVENAADIPKLNFTGDFNDEKEVLHFFLEVLLQSVSLIKSWLTGVQSAFSEVLPEDRDRLAQLRCFHFFLLRFAQRMKVNVEGITLPNGSVYHQTHLQGLMGDILLALAEFAVDLQRSEVDLQSFSCMLILSVLNERDGLKAAEKIESAESKVMDSLRDHCTYNPEAQAQPHLYNRVLGLLPALDNLTGHVISRLSKALADHDMTIPAQLNTLLTTNTPTNLSTSHDLSTSHVQL